MCVFVGVLVCVCVCVFGCEYTDVFAFVRAHVTSGALITNKVNWAIYYIKTQAVYMNIV